VGEAPELDLLSYQRVTAQTCAYIAGKVSFPSLRGVSEMLKGKA
jgi:hypothetical protein